MLRLEELTRDVRYGIRALRQSPTFALVSVVTLALGVGANTAIFSLADVVLFRPLPVSEPRNLVLLRQRAQIGDIFPFTSAAAANLAADRDVLSGLAAFRPIANAQVSVNGETELTLMQAVSGNYHSVLGVPAALGRVLTEQDREPVAVISHRFWQRRFSGDAGVVGRVVQVQGRQFTIVGVTPAAFFGTQPGRHVDVTVPLDTQIVRIGPNARFLYLLGRLAPGVSRVQAQAALRVRWAQSADTQPRRAPVALEVDSGAQGLNELRRQFSVPLRILMATMGVVLLVACANLAGLLIVRSSGRQQEIAVRLSLGASRARVVRQLLTETALLGAFGGAIGVAFANGAANLLLTMMSRGRTPLVLDVAPNMRTLAFAVVVTIATVLLFGLLPALGASRPDIQPILKRSAFGGDRGRNSWGRAMVALQVALVIVLLTSAGLFVRTLQKLRSIDLGFRQNNVLIVTVSTGPGYRGAMASALYDDLFTRFSALPGVQSVSRTMDTPLGGEPSMSTTGVSIAGRPPEGDEAPRVFHNLVGPRFFETMGIPVLRGRDFDNRDDDRAAKCVIVSESLARRYFPGEDALGREILFGATSAAIVGVVKDVRYGGLRAEPPLVTYRPYRQEAGSPANTLLIRTAAIGVETLTPFLRAEVREAAPALPPPTVVSLEDQTAGALVEERMLAALSSAIGALAAILAAIGIHGTVAFVVARRRREIGVRMSIGASPGQIARLMVGEMCAVVAAGVAVGIPLALAAGVAARGLLEGVLFELSPADPVVLVCATTSILVLASLAAYVPVRRAARIDPVAALKCE